MSGFSQPIGFLLRDYVEFTEDQTEYVLLQQAQKIAEINKLDSWVDTYNALLNGSFKEAMPREVPLFGNIAVDMKFATPEQRDVLLAAQGAEKTDLAATGEVDLLNREGKLDLNDRLTTRPFIGASKNGITDPDYLVRAQAADHIAEILSTAKKLDPALDVSVGTQAATSISDVLLYDVASRFNMLGMIKASDAALASMYDRPQFDDYAHHISTLVSEARVAIFKLKENNFISTKQKDQLNNILDQRLEQANLPFKQIRQSGIEQSR